jgi:hypothetical protein
MLSFFLSSSFRFASSTRYFSFLSNSAFFLSSSSFFFFSSYSFFSFSAWIISSRVGPAGTSGLLSTVTLGWNVGVAGTFNADSFTGCGLGTGMSGGTCASYGLIKGSVEGLSG